MGQLTGAQKAQYLGILVANEGWDPKTAELMLEYVDRGMDWADAAQAVQSPDLSVMHEAVARPDQATGEKMVPQDVAAWQEYKRAHPVAGYAKERLVEAGRGARDMFGLDQKKGGFQATIDHHERLSAAKMLQDYLLSRDVIRGAEHEKEQLNKAAATPGIMDYLSGMVPAKPPVK